MIKDNKKNNSKKFLIVVILILLFLIISIFCIANFLILSKSRFVSYTENSDLDYKVYLKDNDYYENEYLEKNNRYIASLIDNIVANFKYELSFDKKEDVSYEYSYDVIAETKVIDKDNKDTIYNNKKVLYSSSKQSGKNEIKITHDFTINYNYYNDLISGFIKLYDLDETNCFLNIKMIVNIKSNSNEKFEDINKESVVSISIPLTTKTVAIDMFSDVTNNETNNLLVTNSGNYIGLLAMGLGSLVISLLYFLGLLTYYMKTRSATEIYNRQLKRLLSNYGADIQVVTNDYKIGAVRVLKISSFEDMLEIKETTKSPLLMIENKQKTGAFFIIQTNYDVIYTYALRVQDIKAKREGVDAPDYDIKNINKDAKTKKYTKEFIDKQLTETIALSPIDGENAILGNKDSNADIYKQLEETREYRLDDLKKTKKSLTTKKGKNKKISKNAK